MPTDKRGEKSDAPESEIDTSDSENVGYRSALDSSPSQTESATQRLLGPPEVAQTRPKGGCQAAMPRRVRRGWDVRTVDKTAAVEARKESAASCTVDSRMEHRMSECITAVAPGLEAAPQAAHEIVQPRRPVCSYTEPLPLGSGCLDSVGYDTRVGNPPAEMHIYKSPDHLQTETSVTSMELADGSLPADIDILTTPDTLQTEVSVMAVMSEKWMERFVMIAPDDDPESRSSDGGGDAGVIQDLMPTVVSVRPEVTEKWMDRFVVDLVECLSVSRTIAVARTFGPAVSEEYSPGFFCWGGGVVADDVYPLVVVESDTVEVSVLQSVESDKARVSVLIVCPDCCRL